MNASAAQEMDVFGVVEVVAAVAAVAEPTTAPASAAPAFALPILMKREINQVPYI